MAISQSTVQQKWNSNPLTYTSLSAVWQTGKPIGFRYRLEFNEKVNHVEACVDGLVTYLH